MDLLNELLIEDQRLLKDLVKCAIPEVQRYAPIDGQILPFVYVGHLENYLIHSIQSDQAVFDRHLNQPIYQLAEQFTYIIQGGNLSDHGLQFGVVKPAELADARKKDDHHAHDLAIALQSLRS